MNGGATTIATYRRAPCRPSKPGRSAARAHATSDMTLDRLSLHSQQHSSSFEQTTNETPRCYNDDATAAATATLKNIKGGRVNLFDETESTQDCSDASDDTEELLWEKAQQYTDENKRLQTYWNLCYPDQNEERAKKKNVQEAAQRQKTPSKSW